MFALRLIDDGIDPEDQAMIAYSLIICVCMLHAPLSLSSDDSKGDSSRKDCVASLRHCVIRRILLSFRGRPDGFTRISCALIPRRMNWFCRE